MSHGLKYQGHTLKGELYLNFNDNCSKHPKSTLKAYDVGPAWEFYCCSECEVSPAEPETIPCSAHIGMFEKDCPWCVAWKNYSETRFHEKEFKND